jgi:peptide/nickel transport system substrate-binding protein
MDSIRQRLSRRGVLRLTGVGVGGVGLGLAALPGLSRPGPVGAQEGETAGTIVVDLPEEPRTLDPALTYDPNGWSIVHSVYDSLVQFGPDGELEPLLAESYAVVDPTTYEVELRSGIAFHNGESLDAAAVAFSVARLQDEATGSQVRQNFLVIQEVQEVDPLTVRFVLSQPAPWLWSQIAAWLAILPPGYAGDPANDFAAAPVGTGPYVFAGWERGQSVALTINPDYFSGSPKGAPVAQAVTYRFVPEASTRVADLLSGTADLIRNVPVDQEAAVTEGGARIAAAPVSGISFVRLPTDVAPFDNVQVRQALNHAVDVQAIVDALVGGRGTRLANFFVEGGLGYDPALAPYEYDPDRARTLLAEAGYPDGFATAMAYTTADQLDVVRAVAGMLEEIGVSVELQPTDLAIFNDTWADPESAPLRMVTWRPMFDPYTLLSLLVSNQGFLSRYDNPNAQILIDAAATDSDPTARAATYRDLGQVLRDEPAGIYLHSLTALYGEASDLPAWTPRPDEYVLLTVAP